MTWRAHHIDWILLKRDRNGAAEQIGCTSRQNALIRHINTMPANLLRAYLSDLLTDAPDGEIEKFIVAFRAQNVVQGKS